jgi:hypothetical protein
MGRALVNKTSAIDDTRGLVNKYTDDGRMIVNKPTRGIVNKDSILNNQNVRVKKRISVIPFDGEENFIVPKRGGFGQPDNENFVMVAGANLPAPNTPNDPSNTGQNGMGVPIGQPQEPILTPQNTPNLPTTPIEPTPTTPAPLTAQQICIANGDSWVNGVCQPRVIADEPSSAETNCINSGGAWINGACVTSTSPKITTTTVPPTSTTTEPPKTTIADAPVVETLPTFPVWSSLDCTTLRDKIAEYNAILSTSRFGATIVEAYNTEIAKAQAIYNTKCNVTTPAPTTSTTTITPLIPIGSIGGGGGVFGGRGGGGGGGGLGEPPTDVAPVEEKSYLGLYLILGGLALLYFLTRKKKQ